MLSGLHATVAASNAREVFLSAAALARGDGSRSSAAEGEGKGASTATPSGSGGGTVDARGRSLLTRQSFEQLLDEQSVQDRPSKGRQTAVVSKSDGGGGSSCSCPEGACTCGSGNSDDLSDEEQRIVARLRQRDAEVRAHEQAHKTAGAGLTGAASFEYQRGPDGRNYAVSGEVKIDISPEGDPEDTIRKMEVVKRAALAPAEPSPQDRQVAAQADALKAQAQQELNKQEREEEAESRDEGKGGNDPAGQAAQTASETKPSPGQKAIEKAIAAYTVLDPAQARREEAAIDANLDDFGAPRGQNTRDEGDDGPRPVTPEALYSIAASAINLLA